MQEDEGRGGLSPSPFPVGTVGKCVRGGGGGKTFQGTKGEKDVLLVCMAWENVAIYAMSVCLFHFLLLLFGHVVDFAMPIQTDVRACMIVVPACTA